MLSPAAAGPAAAGPTASGVAEDCAGRGLLGRLHLHNRAKSLAGLAALLALAPACLLVVAACWLIAAPPRVAGRLAGRGRRGAAAPQRTVLITGGKMTKALELCRAFDAAGWRVVLCETPKYWLTGHRFSRAVDRFRLTPELGDPAYADALARIAREENAALFVPVSSPASSRVESLAAGRLPPGCRVVHVGADQIDLLDDKFLLARAAADAGLPAPRSFRVTHPSQVDDAFLRGEPRRYLLKSIRYDAVRRLDLTRLPLATPEATSRFVAQLPISADNPWVLQEFIPGEEFCTHSTLQDGRVLVHVCCRSSEFQVNYEHVEAPEVQRWVQEFAAAYRLTGQVSFDFIRAADDGRFYAIECNPRTHSAITAFYRQRRALAEAYAGDAQSPDARPPGAQSPEPHTPQAQAAGSRSAAASAAPPLQPAADARPTYWLYHELWRLLASVPSPRRFAGRLAVVWRGKDAIFAWRDPLPFFAVHHWQLPLLLARDVWEGRGWVRIDFNIGKLVQPAGD
ncbi:MAG: ATP-grasp enzyme [Planctomycetota bacterium]